MEQTVRRSARQVVGEWIDVRARRAALEVLELDLAAELVDLYDTVPESLVEGAERLVPAGHDGTPLLAEFLVAELAPLLGCSVDSARGLVADVTDLRHRMPRLWEAVHRGAVAVWQARRLVRAPGLGDLSLPQARAVDEALAPILGRVSFGRVNRKLAGLIVQQAPDLAARRAEARRTARFVHIDHEPDGMSALFARLPTAGMVLLEEAIDGIARRRVATGASTTLAQARADALVDLATPSSRPSSPPRPRSTLVVHLAPGSEVARSDEVGPLLLGQVRQMLGHHHVSVLPVVDLADDPSADSYEVPEHIRRHVQVRDSYEVFPFSDKPAHRCDQDHTIAYDPDGPPGQTRASNLGSLSRFVHRWKTHGGASLHQPSPGVFELVTPLGFRYPMGRDGTGAWRVSYHHEPRPDLGPPPEPG